MSLVFRPVHWGNYYPVIILLCGINLRWDVVSTMTPCFPILKGSVMKKFKFHATMKCELCAMEFWGMACIRLFWGSKRKEGSQFHMVHIPTAGDTLSETIFRLLWKETSTDVFEASVHQESCLSNTSHCFLFPQAVLWILTALPASSSQEKDISEPSKHSLSSCRHCSQYNHLLAKLPISRNMCMF